MINFLHNFNPDPILFYWNGIKINWYGFLIVLGIVLGTLLAIKLAKYYQIPKELILDLAFWLIIGGILGARIYHVGLEFSYYLTHPLNIFKVWEGGLAIHGAVIGGIIVLLIFARFATGLSGNFKKNFWLLSSIAAPALILAQAVGRWGNYFNQELFGRPTDLPWGIPIAETNRPIMYMGDQYFHPTFLYESLGNLLIFVILLGIHIYLIKKGKQNWEVVVVSYLVLYSLLRFFTEFIRIDPTPMVAGLRFPQIMSLILIVLALLLTVPRIRRKITK